MSLVFYMKGKTETSVEYVDKLPEGMTAQEFKKQYGVVVWCDYFGCKYNAQVADTQRTTGKLLNKRGYQPLGQDAGVWRGLCTRGEIGIQFDQVITASGNKQKIPHCFTSSTTKTGHLDFAKFLQSDGTPYGGSIESRAPDLSGYDIMQGNNVWGV